MAQAQRQDGEPPRQLSRHFWPGASPQRRKPLSLGAGVGQHFIILYLHPINRLEILIAQKKVLSYFGVHDIQSEL